MAILFSQSDGSDQHYDTYEEFEQAMILMKRLNGEEVPKDLLDEVRAENGGKETKPIQVQINGINFESAIREEVKEATRELAEALDEVAKDRTPESDECEVPEKTPKFEVGDRVKVVDNLSGGHPKGTVGVIESVNYDWGTFEYEVGPKSGSPYGYTLYHDEEELESTEDFSSGFRTGDVVKVTESFSDILGDRAICGAVYNYDENLGFGEPFVGTVFLGDNIDKIELVCRAQDRLDKY